MIFKTSLTVVSLLSNFLFTGWILNWAPMDVMLTSEGYYADLCTEQISLSSKSTPKYTSCDEQQVMISALWSAVLLSEFTVLPNGIILDWVGPTLFSLLIGIIHVGSIIATINISRSSNLLPITFFFMGTAAQACSLLAMRTVYIFDTPRARKRWIIACCTIFDSSAICTMIFYNLWEVDLIRLDTMFWVLTILGGVLFGAQTLLWLGFNRSSSKSEDLVIITEEFPLLEKPPQISVQMDLSEDEITLVDIFCGYKFYFFILFCAVNIYRIRYFLGLANYTLVNLHDDGTYLQLLGYSFALSIVFAPLVDKILQQVESRFCSLQIVNASITAFFVTWMIPNLQLQIVTFALFILARLFTFSVINQYCSEEFSEKRFGLVLGAGFMAAAIPGAFTYKIVEVVLAKYNNNFWAFHLICISMSIPLALIIFIVQRKSNGLISQRSDEQSVSFTPRRSFIVS